MKKAYGCDLREKFIIPDKTKKLYESPKTWRCVRQKYLDLAGTFKDCMEQKLPQKRESMMPTSFPEGLTPSFKANNLAISELVSEILTFMVVLRISHYPSISSTKTTRFPTIGSRTNLWRERLSRSPYPQWNPRTGYGSYHQSSPHGLTTVKKGLYTNPGRARIYAIKYNGGPSMISCLVKGGVANGAYVLIEENGVLGADESRKVPWPVVLRTPALTLKRSIGVDQEYPCNSNSNRLLVLDGAVGGLRCDYDGIWAFVGWKVYLPTFRIYNREYGGAGWKIFEGLKCMYKIIHFLCNNSLRAKVNREGELDLLNLLQEIETLFSRVSSWARLEI
ncbi:uncharacterized protein BDR25DRAFT_353548 [Lindgomyces ingoldianus]|uniref:Uncharacterized protein n=1 Tax=Lindgomyces ingoldianus TaxID=673940 RepID=A0ACB6QZS7_9PLEO|nr:uncharacterized protein BDR25DRAFT_353548 [Lindgomyces ingoldianus]KAF2472533.1 hypothetical protein BDR25DRAFT_353548 [Lindgomyces ingoldianus]